MKDIGRRVKNVEKRLNLSERPENEVKNIVLQCVNTHRGGLNEIPQEHAKEWLTYKEQLNNEPVNGFRFIYLDPDEELKARAVQKEAVIG